MTLILTESFDVWGPNGEIPGVPGAASGKWDTANFGVRSAAPALHGLYGNRGAGSGSTVMLGKTLTSAEEDDLLIVGGAIYQLLPTFGNVWLKLRGDGRTVTHLEFSTDGTGKPVVRRGDSGTVLGTASAAFPTGAWVYVEVKARLHDSAGTVEVRIDETTVLSLTGQDTKNGGVDAVFDGVEFWTSTGSQDIRWDDIYVCNEQGSTNNGYLGAVIVEGLQPNGNGNSSQFVGSDGNSTDNYLLVDDGISTGTIDDADYVESDTDNNKDTYAFENSVYASPQSIYGVMAYARARRSDTGARTLAIVGRSGSTEVDSADLAIPTSGEDFKWVSHAYETKPGGGSWTFTDLNAAEFGVKARP